MTPPRPDVAGLIAEVRSRQYGRIIDDEPLVLDENQPPILADDLAIAVHLADSVDELHAEIDRLQALQPAFTEEEIRLVRDYSRWGSQPQLADIADKIAARVGTSATTTAVSNNARSCLVCGGVATVVVMIEMPEGYSKPGTWYCRDHAPHAPRETT